MKNTQELFSRIKANGYNVVYAHNSIFTLLTEYASGALATDATTGLVRKLSYSVGLFKDKIIPAANEIEKKIKELSATRIFTIVDDTEFVVINYNHAVDTLVDNNMVELRNTQVLASLPTAPLVIDLDDVETLLSTTNREFTANIKELAATKPNEYLIKLHNDVFGSLSNINVRITNIGYDIVGNIDDILILYAMTFNYLETMGSSNKTVADAKTLYLSRLLQVLNSFTSIYKMQYSRYLANDVLIVKTLHDDQDTSSGYKVTVVGETYNKYLETNSVNAIFGYLLVTGTGDSVSLTTMLEQVTQYTEAFDSNTRREKLKAELNNTLTMRLAYTTAFSKYLTALSEEQVGDICGVGDVKHVVAAINEKVDAALPAELNDITNTVRYITGSIIFNRPDFPEFVANMNYYSEMNAKLTPEEVATAATIGMVVTYLMRQMTFNKGT